MIGEDIFLQQIDRCTTYRIGKIAEKDKNGNIKLLWKKGKSWKKTEKIFSEKRRKNRKIDKKEKNRKKKMRKKQEMK